MEKKIALSIKGLKVRYGAIEAVKGIDLEVPEGSVVALLGANGAGKTSTLQTISGLNRAAEGTITYYGKDITNMDAEKIAALGMSQSPEGRQIFGDLTVEENLWAGSFTLKDKKKIKSALLEGLVEIVLTLVSFGIGALIVSLFGVKPDSPNVDGDSIILLGIVAICVTFAIVYAIVQWFKKTIGNKNK